MVPSRGILIRRPLPSTGSRRERFPRFIGTTRRSDSLPPYPPAFIVLRHAVTVVHRTVRSAWGIDACPGGREDVTRPLPHDRSYSTATTGPLRFLENPFGHVPRSSTPVGRRCSADCRTPDGASRHSEDVGPTTFTTFGAQSRGSRPRCLRFAPGVAPKDARLATGCLSQAWPDGIGYPLGSITRFQVRS